MAKRKTLDLHSVKHEDAKLMVEQFIWQNREKLPLRVITGNSTRMRAIVKETVEELGYNIFDFGKFGEIDVF